MKLYNGGVFFWRQATVTTQTQRRLFLNDCLLSAKESGLTVFLVEGSHASGTSFLDGEAPVLDMGSVKTK
jgi:hypothetical protein